MDHVKYLDRIKYNGEIKVSIEILNKLQKCHLLTVPFENLDIHAGKKIKFKNTYDKVVNKGRGGFCYELNWLFYLLLKETGFTVKLISARGYDKIKGFGPEFDHMAIIATINNTGYLADVGFGEFSFSPLQIRSGELQVDQRGNFIIENYDDHYLIVKKKSGKIFEPEYIFSETKRKLSDFKGMCDFHQLSSDSHFTKKRLCSLPTENGRITLTGHTLKITDKDSVTEIQLKNEEEFNRELRNHFNINL